MTLCVETPSEGVRTGDGRGLEGDGLPEVSEVIPRVDGVRLPAHLDDDAFGGAGVLRQVRVDLTADRRRTCTTRKDDVLN